MPYVITTREAVLVLRRLAEESRDRLGARRLEKQRALPGFDAEDLDSPGTHEYIRAENEANHADSESQALALALHELERLEQEEERERAKVEDWATASRL